MEPLGFIQIMHFTTYQPDALRQLGNDWQRDTVGRNTVQRTILTHDVANTNKFTMIVFFDSEEDAAINNDLPKTQAFAEAMALLVDGDIIYHNLIVQEDWTWASLTRALEANF